MWCGRRGPAQQRLRLAGAALAETQHAKMDQRIQMRRLGQQQLLVSAGRFLGPALAMQRQRPLEFHYDYPGFARPAGILAPSGRNVPARPFVERN
jgi:hypothetical protein